MAKTKIKIPKSVLELKCSPKKFGKKHGIRIKKGMSKKEKKYFRKRLWKEYGNYAAAAMNVAVKLLAENNPDTHKLNKVKTGVENVITTPKAMDAVIKEYNKHPKRYPYMIYLPKMILNTIEYYSQEDIPEDDKELAASLNTNKMMKFCEKILKKQIKYYKKRGFSDTSAFVLASVAPSTKIFARGDHYYRRLISELYKLAGVDDTPIDLNTVLNAIYKIDKHYVDKKEFINKFFYNFILQRDSNRFKKFTSNQKELKDSLIDYALHYMDGLKPHKLRTMIRSYIKKRKHDEKLKNDSKRMINFLDHSLSNSPYLNIKKVVEDLVKENKSVETYLM